MTESIRLPDSIATVPEALAYWAQRTPDAPALCSHDERTWTHGELDAAIAGAVARLVALGIQPDDQITLLLPVAAETGIALLAAMTAGIAVPFNPGAAASELRRDLERLRPRLLITGGALESIGRQVTTELGLPVVTADELLSTARSPERPLTAQEPVEPERVAAILHTSGTTGLPKRVLRSQRSMVAGARAARQCSALTPDDVALLTTGLHMNSGLVNLCAALCNGGSAVILPGFDPAAYPGWLEAFQPTWTITNATELNMLLAAADAAGRASIAGPTSRLRIMRAGAQPMTPGTDDRAEQSLHALIFDGYGMSEASYITGGGPTIGDRKPGSCGPPLLSEIRVIDPDGNDLPAGETGAIVIRGETLFSGYLDDPEANAAVFLPGAWFRTGDLGSLDADGYLFLRGRMNELINRGGEKIAPVEVDNALLAHPAVADAATFAVPDARLGEDIVAAVVLHEGMSVTPRELRSWLLDRLSTYKVPRRIWFVEHLPRTASGKVQRGELALRWGETDKRQV